MCYGTGTSSCGNEDFAKICVFCTSRIVQFFSRLGSFSRSSLIDLWCVVEGEGQLATKFSICEDFLFFVKAAFVVFSWEFSALSSLIYCCFTKGNDICQAAVISRKQDIILRHSMASS